MYMYNINDTLFSNQTENPDNANFNIAVSGTTNMTTIYKANSFVAKGHYYQLSEEAKSSIPTIVDANMDEIEASEDADDTKIGVDMYSGVCLLSMQRIFYNMQIFNDELFKNFLPEIPDDYGYFYPVAYVSREFSWSQNQFDNQFSSRISVFKWKAVIFWLSLFFAILFVILTVIFVIRYCRFKNELPAIVAHDSKTKDLVDNKKTAYEPNKRYSLNSEEERFLQSSNLKDKAAEANSEDEFADERPSVEQNARVFNLTGQGKPIAQLEHLEDTMDNSQSTSGQLNSGKLL